MNTHTNYIYDTEEEARRAMHAFLKNGQHVWGKSSQELRSNGQKGKKKTQYVRPTDDGRWMIMVENEVLEVE